MAMGKRKRESAAGYLFEFLLDHLWSR